MSHKQLPIQVSIEPYYNFELILIDVPKLFNWFHIHGHLKTMIDIEIMHILKHLSAPCLIIFLG